MKAKLSIIIVSFNTSALLADCLASIYAHTRRVPFEVIVVDNNSRDDSCRMVRERFPQARLIESRENLGFGAANNLGAKEADAPFLMLFNSDALLVGDTGAALVEFLERETGAGAVGPRVLLMDGTRQTKTFGHLPTLRPLLNQNLLFSSLWPRSRFFSGIFVEEPWDSTMEVGWVSGVCMAIRREAYLQIGGFDPALFLYAEDIDLCLRLTQAGWRIYRVEDQAIRHVCGGSTRTPRQMLQNAVMQQRNFLRVIDRCAGFAGALLSRVLLGVGLVLRVLLRGILFLLRGRERDGFQRAWICLLDLVGLLPKTFERTA
jgi:GT2 family glycosyltransferase